MIVRLTEAGWTGVVARLAHLGVAPPRPAIRSVPRARLLEMEAAARRTALPPLRSLAQYWVIEVDGDTAPKVIERLTAEPGVEQCYESPVYVPAGGTPDHSGHQGYLDEAKTGIDARWLWKQANGRGAGVQLVDIEPGWRLAHEDLPPIPPSLLGTSSTVSDDRSHGAAVLGIIAAMHNGFGVQGIAPDIDAVWVASSVDLEDAILAAIEAIHVGDVIVLPVQTPASEEEVSEGQLPVEASTGVAAGQTVVFHAIRLASALGYIVVEAAGNGAEDLDALGLLTEESGAILVGAAGSTVPHEPLEANSNSGKRIDCFAWGRNIYACGYGGADSSMDEAEAYTAYTRRFAGTSGASAIVAGAAVLVQGRYKGQTGVPLTALQMRAALRAGGTKTSGDEATGKDTDRRGVMPNLRAIVENHLSLVPDVYVRDSLMDTGTVPSVGIISASPDIIVTHQMLDGEDAFGLGSPYEGQMGPGGVIQKGRTQWVYVRVTNRGGAAARATRATVYYARAATLVHPTQWTPIGTSVARNVPADGITHVLPRIGWPASRQPGPGQYCFIAVLHTEGDDVLVPTGPDPIEFAAFVRNNNNVAWRNFSLVASLLALPEFRITGFPEDRRTFDLELRLALPRDTRLYLEVPESGLEFFSRTEGLGRPERRPNGAFMLRVPSAPRGRVRSVVIPAAQGHAVRWVVEGEAPRRGHGISIIQYYEGTAVGGLHWRVEPGQPSPRSKVLKVLRDRKKDD